MAKVQRLKTAPVTIEAVAFGTPGLFAGIPQFPSPPVDPEQALRDAMRGDKAQKLRYFRGRCVLFPAFLNALERVAFLIQQATLLDEPGGALILAEGGCGKSFLGEQLARRFPVAESLYQLEVPIVFVDMRQRPDEKGFLLGMLAQVGERISRNDFSVAELMAKLVVALRRVQCRCIFVDEAQRLDTVTKNRRGEDRKLGPIGELLKELYTKAGVTIILAGTPSLDDLIKSDAQFSTRWSGRVCLSSFELGGEFYGVLKALTTSLPLSGKTDFSSPEIAEAIWKASQGNFRRLKIFLGNALALAIDAGADAMHPAHLQQAYLMTGDFSQENPFARLVK